MNSCEFCGHNRTHKLSDNNSTTEYLSCLNCLYSLINLCLTPQQFLRAKDAGGDVNRFYLHEDFYDERTGEALQPK